MKKLPNLIRTLLLRSALSAAAVTSLVVINPPQVAHAANECSDLFVSADMQAHEAAYRNFVGGALEGRLTNRAARSLMLSRLRKVLPAGEHVVILNFHKRDKMHVSYDASGEVTIRLAGRAPLQSNGVTLKRGFWLVPNMSYGIDGRVQLFPGDRMAISTTVIRGDETTIAGLERTDLSFEINYNNGTGIVVTETSSNWSTYRPQSYGKTTRIRVEPVK